MRRDQPCVVLPHSSRFESEAPRQEWNNGAGNDDRTEWTTRHKRLEDRPGGGLAIDPDLGSRLMTAHEVFSAMNGD